MREFVEPSPIEGHEIWRGALRGARFLFVGRSGDGRREACGPLRVPALPRLRVAHLRQVHGVRLVDATAGPCGEGDALQTSEHDLALCIQTADCVPVLLVGDSRVVAIHAGWRGIAAGIIGSTVDTLDDGQGYQAIIGPAIGPCCYEVDGDVADAVEAALPSPRAIDRRSRSKPHLDLQLAVAEQLFRHGTKTTEWVRTCTRCSENLWSYRRDGPGKGRNLAFVWSERPLA